MALISICPIALSRTRAKAAMVSVSCGVPVYLPGVAGITMTLTAANEWEPSGLTTARSNDMGAV